MDLDIRYSNEERIFLEKEWIRAMKMKWGQVKLG